MDLLRRRPFSFSNHRRVSSKMGRRLDFLALMGDGNGETSYRVVPNEQRPSKPMKKPGGEETSS